MFAFCISDHDLDEVKIKPEFLFTVFFTLLCFVLTSWMIIGNLDKTSAGLGLNKYYKIILFQLCAYVHLYTTCNFTLPSRSHTWIEVLNISKNNSELASLNFRIACRPGKVLHNYSIFENKIISTMHNYVLIIFLVEM